MYRQIPNIITVSRLGLTVVFFTLLNVHDPDNFTRVMWWAFGVFLVAVLTDWLDGYLARKWKAESAFGRVVDPFVDKILIAGAFVFFSSTNFINVEMLEKFDRSQAVTGVTPWMAVVLIGREFLITGIRGLAEARGIDFRADWAGKVKMIVQCIAVGAVMVDVATVGRYPLIHWTRDITIWTTIIVTVLSATSYIIRARRVMKD